MGNPSLVLIPLHLTCTMLARLSVRASRPSSRFIRSIYSSPIYKNQLLPISCQCITPFSHASREKSSWFSSRPLLYASLLSASVLFSTTSNADADNYAHVFTWAGVIRELRRHQQANSLPPFSTARHASKDGWCYSLRLHCAPSAPLYSLLLSMVRDLLGGEAEIAVDDTATRTVFTLTKQDRFEVAISVPRVTPFETTVSVELTRAEGPEATFSVEEVDALVSAYVLAHGQHDIGAGVEGGAMLDGKDADFGPATVLDRGRDGYGDDFASSLRNGSGNGTGRGSARIRRAKKKLEELGVEVFSGAESDLEWTALAGYDDVKQQIENTLTLPLKHPDVYDRIVRGTRERYESNLPKACLFEGPPGCGKTLSAKILAASIGVPFVHIPLETILSKFYGETTRKLSEILQTANELGKCLVFIDECDSIGMSRSSGTEIHEVTRRTLSILLRHIDGMDGPQDTILLAATNHKEDIDPALMSRFDVVVSFPLPDVPTRQAVLSLYAKHLDEDELRTMAELSAGFSGRELLDVCEEAERTYAGYIVRGTSESEQVNSKQADRELPGIEEYLDAIKRKAPHVVGRNKRAGGKVREPGTHSVAVGPRPSMAM